MTGAGFQSCQLDGHLPAMLPTNIDHRLEAHLDEVEVVRDAQRLRVDGLVEVGLGEIMLHDPLEDLEHRARSRSDMPGLGPPKA